MRHKNKNKSAKGLVNMKSKNKFYYLKLYDESIPCRAILRIKERNRYKVLKIIGSIYKTGRINLNADIDELYEALKQNNIKYERIALEKIIF